MTAPRSILEDRRDVALRDLAELDDQVDADELDPSTARMLRRRYEADAAAAIRALETLDQQHPGPAGDESSSAGRRGRGIAATAGVAVLLAVGAAVALPRFVDTRPEGGFVTGNEAIDGPRWDLAQVTNEEMEQVVAANPGVVDMRLRLAHRYLDEGEFMDAYDHYMAVLEREPNPEAMSHLGWVVFSDGQVDLALELLDASRRRDPGNAETLWFLANVELYGRDDPDAALDLLERLQRRDDLQQRDQLDRTIAVARRRAGTP